MNRFLKKYYRLAIALTLIAAIVVLCFVDTTPSDNNKPFHIILKKDKFVPFFKEARWEEDDLVLIPEFASVFPDGEYTVRIFLKDKNSGDIVNMFGHFRVGGPEVLKKVVVSPAEFTVIYDWKEKKEYAYGNAVNWIRRADLGAYQIDMVNTMFFAWFDSAPNVTEGGLHDSGGIYSDQFIIQHGRISKERWRNKYIVLDNRTVSHFLENGLLIIADTLISDKDGPGFKRYRFDSWYELRRDLWRIYKINNPSIEELVD